MKHIPVHFPKNFLWGVATASAQIEGGANEDGKGESIWDYYARQGGFVTNNETPSIACDHYHRYRTDFRLLRKLGVKNYRFSVAWPRVIPDGDGAVNIRGLDFYDRLVDAMLAQGITPWCTLFHWDLPYMLEKKGGWISRSVPTAFRRYTDVVVRRLGDRVKRWMTWNEIFCFIGKGYGDGILAPFRKEGRRAVLQAYHHGLLAHGYGVASIREYGGKNARVGFVNNPACWVPLAPTNADIAAAKTLFRRENEMILDPILRGRYPRLSWNEWGKNAPRIKRQDMSLIGQKIDFVGYNIYTAQYATADRNGIPRRFSFSEDYPRADMSWLHIVPQSLYWTFRFSDEIYGPQNYYVTENGCAYSVGPDRNGDIEDVERIHFLREYLFHLRRAIVEGHAIKGYFLWSFLDNYEWAEGYSKRFGIVHIDYRTQKRTPKLSAKWYSKVIAENAID